MSSKYPVFSEFQVETALAEAAGLIFHPQLFRSMPKISLGQEGEQSQTEPPMDNWPGKIAAAYVRLPVLSNFIQACASDALRVLMADDPKANPTGLKADEMCSSAKAQAVLRSFIAQLIQRPSDAKWIGIIMFSLLRTSEETIGNAVSAEEMTDMTFAVSMMNSAIVSGDAWELGFVTKRTLTVPEIESSLRNHIASRVTIALSSMVAADPDAIFFEGQGVSSFH
ncbi:hypothetical protein IYR97_24515 (plasmid) [Pseudomonas fulva]|uniref:Uncharacterized protein n=3 Tax=Pseudomonas putida group TaxID=136845 RepID=A0ABD7BP32_PSEPU|nr:MULTISPECIES: hypothetical protein [Pseudomonas]MCT8162677.1 hypothetical protein [Pseudomonas sp. HD6422]MCT8181554.1 hypothetical protein [Pseudomonas sp. HD6421]MDH1932435.1 hypothetical protein [Pseudomonas sp. GD03696]QIZ22747.1 Hypothetical protein [Pseudomonas putida]QOD01153.1 hypothetical protein ID616_31615 [Pseudomonas putida]